MNDKDKPQCDAAAQEELNGVPEEFLDDGEADSAQPGAGADALGEALEALRGDL